VVSEKKERLHTAREAMATMIIIIIIIIMIPSILSPLRLPGHSAPTQAYK